MRLSANHPAVGSRGVVRSVGFGDAQGVAHGEHVDAHAEGLELSVAACGVVGDDRDAIAGG